MSHSIIRFQSNTSGSKIPKQLNANRMADDAELSTPLAFCHLSISVRMRRRIVRSMDLIVVKELFHIESKSSTHLDHNHHCFFS